MARFNDDEIGGRETGAWRLVPSQRTRIEDALKYEKIATKILGNFKQQLQNSGLSSGKSEITTLLDGTRIFVKTSTIGLADADEVHIDVAESARSQEYVYILGYILRGSASSNDDPGYNQYLRFDVKFSNTNSFNPVNGDDPDITAFDNYPDNGAKYVTRGGIDNTAVDVYISRYYSTFGLVSYTGPSHVEIPSSCGGAATLPSLNAEYHYATYVTGYLALTDGGYLGNLYNQGSHDFVYVQHDGSPSTATYWDTFPTANDWQDAFTRWWTYEQFTPMVTLINARLAEYYTNAITYDYTQDNIDDYSTLLNGSHWINKHINNNGFASDLGFYVDINGVMVLSERYEFHDNESVGQGFLVMVDKNHQLKVSQEIVTNNDFSNYGESSVTDSPLIAVQWEKTPGAPPDVVTVADGTFTNGGNVREPILGSSTLVDLSCRITYDTLATYTSFNEVAFITVPDVFTLDCEVPSGIHEITVNRWFSDETFAAYEKNVDIYLFTTMGAFKIRRSAGEFDTDSTTSNSKITIPVKTPIEFNGDISNLLAAIG